MLEILSLFDALECRSRLGYPELVLWVCEDTDIGQADGLGYGSHGGLVLRTEEAGGGGTRRGGQACKACFLVREHSGGGWRFASSCVVQAFRCSSGRAGRANDL